MANDKADTPDFTDLDFSAQDSDEAGGLGNADLTPQFEALDDAVDDLLPLAEGTDQPEPVGGDLTGSNAVSDAEDVAEQLDVLEQEEISVGEEEGQEPSKEEDQRAGFLTRLGRTSPYTVMLAMALVAILISITYLFLDLEQYEFDMKAEHGRPPSAAAEIVLPGPANTTAMV